jgi:CBS domain-containing protein
MIVCPYCGSENIDGDEECAECLQPLVDAYLAPPTNDVERSLLRDRISVLEPKRPITVAGTTPLGDVLRLMVFERIGCVIVVDGEKTVGIFSERDAVQRVGVRVRELAAQPVSAFMTPNPQTVLADAKLAYAVQRMDLGGYRHLPIVEGEGKLVGIISARDILRYVTEKMAVGR